MALMQRKWRVCNLKVYVLQLENTLRSVSACCSFYPFLTLFSAAVFGGLYPCFLHFVPLFLYRYIYIY